MPGLLKTLKKWLSDSYDYLGLVLMASLLWFSVVLASSAILIRIAHGGIYPTVIGGALLYILAVAPVMAGMFVMARKIVYRDDPSLRHIISGVRELYLPAWALGFAQVVVTLAISVNAWFYLTRGMMAFRLLGVLFLYALLIWALSSIYHYPILVHQRPGVIKTFKRAFLLSLDNVAFTAGVFFVIILLTCFCISTFLGMTLLFMGMLSLLCTNALRSLLVKYDLLEIGTDTPKEDAALETGDSRL